MVELIWDNKQEMLVEINSETFYQTDKELIPCIEESKNFDTTENLYIEGDNLDALKLLKKDYGNKVKMIYIDPPYNTEKKFIYNDTFRNKKKKECRHSGWLNMMYPRLKLARDLLTDDGVIFISIDDNEVENLKKVCNEIFGDSNFISTVCVETSNGLFGLKAKFAYSTIVKSKDYILVYSKTQSNFNFSPLYVKSKKLFDTHFTFYKDENYECSLNEFLENNSLVSSKAKIINVTPNVSNLDLLMNSFSDVYNLIMNEVNHIFRIREYTLNICESDLLLLRDGKKHKIGDVFVFLENSKINYLYPFSKIVKYSDDYNSVFCSCVLQGDLWKGFNDDMGNIGKEGDVKFENGKKPIRLIKNIFKLINNNNCTILDFFSGSATTAHAVMQLNAEDGGNRKFIMVQLPEPCDEKTQSEFKNICEIGKERIRRAAKKIHEDKPDAVFDDGFKVYKIN